MRYSTLSYHLFSLALISSTASSYLQKPLMDNLGPVIPPEHLEPPPESQPTGEVLLTDVLGRDRSINVFSGFARDIDNVDQLLGNKEENTTVMAPLNSAIMALPRKPWEDPDDYAVLGPHAYKGSDGEDRAHRNLRRFVESHIVTVSPWLEGEKVRTLTGMEIKYEIRDGVKLIQPGNVEVISVASNVANGQVWILKNTMNYA